MVTNDPESNLTGKLERRSEKDVAVLRWQSEDGGKLALYLQPEEVVDIGRQLNNDLQIKSPQVSLQHAIVNWRDQAFYIKDLNSETGTYLNNEEVGEPRKLQNGDEIKIGEVTLRYYSLDKISEVEGTPVEDADSVIMPKRINQPRLLVVSGFQEGRVINIVAQKMVIGRSSSTQAWDISVQDQAVSRPHAEITTKEKAIIITDLKSANGTLVNNIWITEPVELENGDLIDIGETLMLFRDR